VRAIFLTALAATSIACASKQSEEGVAPSPTVMRPLERMTGQPIVVFPIQYFAATDSLGWQSQIPDRAAFLSRLDEEIEATLAARGLGHTWTFAREVSRAAQLNSILGINAHQLSAEWLRGRVLPDQTVRDPLATQVRQLVGLKGSRYALLPVELRLQSHGGTGVATLRVVMIDSRLAQIRWVGEVSSDPMRTFSPALATSVATHFADLIVAP
jgi:hypothetical protein